MRSTTRRRRRVSRFRGYPGDRAWSQIDCQRRCAFEYSNGRPRGELRQEISQMRRLLLAGLLVVLGFGGYFVLTAPFTWIALHPLRDIADGAQPDLANGRSLFFAGSCGICHASPGQKEDTRLGGGLTRVSAFGTFYMPNMSPDTTDGIGKWTTAQFTRAMREGVSDDGHNEDPAFPYTSFQRMTANDLRDLFGFIKTLPAVTGKARDNDLKFPSAMGSGVGLWKLLFLDGLPLVADAQKSPDWNRGRYLVEGPARCAECHSPRNLLGAIVADKRFSGAPIRRATAMLRTSPPTTPALVIGPSARLPTISAPA